MCSKPPAVRFPPIRSSGRSPYHRSNNNTIDNFHRYRSERRHLDCLKQDEDCRIYLSPAHVVDRATIELSRWMQTKSTLPKHKTPNRAYVSVHLIGRLFSKRDLTTNDP